MTQLSDAPRRYFITGGAGNLACQLTHELARRGDSIVLFDLAPAPTASVAPGSEYVRGDLTSAEDLEGALRRARPDWIFHFASLLSGKSEEDRPLAWRVNMDGTFALFEAALRTGVRGVFFPSSVASYGGRLPDPLPEDFPQWPQSLYGVTKLAAERLGVYYHERHGLDFRSLRVPVVISAFAPPGAASAYASRAFIDAARHKRFTFRVHPDTRVSLIYVKDILRAMLELIDTPPQRLSRRVYNVHALAPSAAEIATAVTARIPDAALDFAPDRAVASLVESWPRQIIDDAARADWGWWPRFDLETMADNFLRELCG